MTTGFDSKFLLEIEAQMKFFVPDISAQDEEVGYLCSNSKSISTCVTYVCSEDGIIHQQVCGNDDDKPDISAQKEEIGYLCSNSKSSSTCVTYVCSENGIIHHQICGNDDDKNGIICEKFSESDVFNEAGCSVVLDEACQNDSSGSFSPKLDGCNRSVSDGNDTVIPDNVVNEASSVGKRKCRSFSGMLDWITRVAADPLNLSAHLSPEMFKWKFCTGEGEFWNQVLSARQVLFSVKAVDNNSDCSILQKKCKMHPSLYTDSSRSKTNERSRYSERLLYAKKSKEHVASDSSSSTQGHVDASPSARTNDVPNKSKSHDSDFLSSLRKSSNTRKRVRVGHFFQAKLPQWTVIATESNPRWLGRKIWPIGRQENQPEMDIIPNIVNEVCSCPNPSSYDCIRCHITERRKKMKHELGSAFYGWSFDTMGDDVSLSWGGKDQRKFEKIVRSNPPSEGRSFWDEICKSFPHKLKKELVSYYYNVFLLRERGKQNRNFPDEIDSDDDCESRFTAIHNENGC